MRYAPIGNEREALDRINGLGFDQYIIASYEEAWQREEGEPEIERTTDIAHAVETCAWSCGASISTEANTPSA